MHARLTRNRKKLFTSKMEETIQLLEQKNLLMHCQLQSLISHLNGGGEDPSPNHPPPVFAFSEMNPTPVTAEAISCDRIH